MNLKIFYSWQTSTDTKYNKNFILSCIEKAVKKLKNKPELVGVDFDIQEGISGESGSVQVASTITDIRIPNCDIFIADLSIINYNFPLSIPIEYHETLKKSTKPMPNPNVLLEYGVAYKSIREERIIGVMNSTLGSLKENSDLLPFDIKHLRFPIEYSYSETTNDKEKAQNELVSSLENAIKLTAIYALQFQRNKFNPLVVWSEWEKSSLIKQTFIPNEKIKEINHLVLTGINTTKQTIRILGLSGLGKTRILLELFRPINDDKNSIILSSRILYLNCNLHPNADYQTIISKIISEQGDHIVILDNCTISTHRQLLHFANREGNKVALITLDSNPEEIERDRITGVNYIILKKEEFSNVIDELLNRDFSYIDKENIKKIKEFSQGIPLMAVLLGESIRDGEKFIGKLNDKELLDKLLGSKGQESKFRTILKSCSIFNYFGFYDELSTQIEFISKSKNITSLNGDDQVILNDFNEICNYYLKREIFEKRGRFISMRPFPLAMSLAQEWLDPLTPKRLINVITEIASLSEPDRSNLSQAFAEQMKYLGYNDKAVIIIEKIIGPNSPFDNAEVVNTELGSRLFRSFVEVNPVAVSQNLVRIFSNKKIDDLIAIKEGRRNLVWVLEKLCFDIRTFNESVKILFSFAVAENETWSNNATGQFLHLFNIHLSGTEAKLDERWRIIEWGLNKEDDNYYELAIRAMKVGLNYGHFVRMGGAEQQGSKRLYDNEPSWQEVKVYWINILTKLSEIIKYRGKYSDLSSDIIANCIRTFFSLQMGDLIMPFLKDISQFKLWDWDAGLKGLKFARKYEKHLLSNEILNETNDLINSLTKTDFTTRYLTLASSYHLDNDESFSSEKVIKVIVELADEFVLTNISWNETFVSFYSNQQIHSYYFGKRLYELMNGDKNKINHFIELSFEIIKKIPKQERNFTVLGGFIAESSDEVKNVFYLNIEKSTEFSCLLFYFLSIDKEGKKYFYLLFNLIESNKCLLSNFYSFKYSYVLAQLNFDELKEFSEQLFTYKNEGYEIVFDLYFDLGLGVESRKESLIPIFKTCIYKLGFKRKYLRQLDDYKWSEAICLIISNENEIDFAKFINNEVVGSIDFKNSYHLDNYIQRIYEILMKVHFSSIWQDLSAALLSNEDSYIKFYGLKHILGSHIGGVGRTIGVLFDGNIETIFNWCEMNKPLAPSRIAILAPIFDDKNTNYSKWHPIVLRLLNEFGMIKDVLSNLSSNMGTYSWSGSVVPFLESKKNLFKQISDHPLEEVRNWANSYIIYIDKDIMIEKNRDAESFL